MASTVLEASASFIARVGGADVLVREGDLADATSEIVRKHPGLFRPLRLKFAAAPKVEQATKAPGEKRG